MADNKTKEERSRNMAAVRSKDTRPEILVRKFLFSKGLRYRLNVSNLPGKPDIVLPKYNTVVFINGCFWHGHENCKYSRLPKSNTDFWEAKISRNVARDADVSTQLEALGWRIIRVWECGLRKVDERRTTLERLYSDIKECESLLLVAEPAIKYGHQ